MATTLDSLLTPLRDLINDEGEMVVLEEAAGLIDGTNKQFTVMGAPIRVGSYTIYVGGLAKTDVSDYGLNTDTGVLTFVVAPGAKVTATYDVLTYGDAQLRRQLANGLNWLRTSDCDFTRSWELEADATTLNVVLEEEEQSLLLHVTASLIVEAELRRSLRRSGVRMTANIGVDRSLEVRNYNESLRELRADRDEMVKRMAQQRMYGWRVPTGMEKG